MLNLTATLQTVQESPDRQTGEIRLKGTFSYFEGQNFKTIVMKLPKHLTMQSAKQFITKDLSMEVRQWRMTTEKGQVLSGFFIPEDNHPFKA